MPPTPPLTVGQRRAPCHAPTPPPTHPTPTQTDRRLGLLATGTLLVTGLKARRGGAHFLPVEQVENLVLPLIPFVCTVVVPTVLPRHYVRWRNWW